MATVLAFHAHPDDEALLTGATLAGLAAHGHRVVLVVACDGIMDEASGPQGRLRLDELRRSAAILGVARVEHLGYADSGHGPVLFPDPPDRMRFVRAPVDEAAHQLAAVLTQEHADVLISYDARGGYGHRDHVHVHTVGTRAAELAGTARVLEATRPREPTARAVRLLRRLGVPHRYAPDEVAAGYTPRAQITHVVAGGRFAAQKRAALAAHDSQLRGTGRPAVVARILVRLPVPLFGLLLGKEWFVERATSASPAEPPAPIRPVNRRRHRRRRRRRRY